MADQPSPLDGPILSDEIIDRYATVMQWGVRVAMTSLVVIYVLYLAGVIPALVPHDQLIAIWGEPHERLMETTGLTGGWSWLGYLRFGDMLSLLPIALLAGMSMIGLVIILPAVVRSRDKLFAGTIIALLLILLFAASGLASH